MKFKKSNQNMINMDILVSFSNLNYKKIIQEKLPRKFFKDWENKQGKKTKILGGFSLLAAPLTACNSEDTTPFSQLDLDAAVKKAVDEVDITSDNADILEQGIALGKQYINEGVPDWVNIPRPYDSEGNPLYYAQVITPLTNPVTGEIFMGKNSGYSLNEEAINSLNNIVDLTSDNDAVIQKALTSSDGTIYESVDAAVAAGASSVNENSPVVINATNITLQAEAARLGLTGYEVMTNSQLFAAIRESDNDQAIKDSILTASGGEFDSAITLFQAYNSFNNVTNVITNFAAEEVTENTTGTNGDDNFTTAVIDASGLGTTLNTEDFYNGQEGIDTLSIAFSGNSGGGLNIVGVNTLDVEKLIISNFDTNINEIRLDASEMRDLTTVGTAASSETGDTRVDNIINKISAEMKNGSGDLIINYPTNIIDGNSDTQTLTLADQTGGTFTAQGIETINVISTKTDNKITLSSNQLKYSLLATYN